LTLEYVQFTNAGQYSIAVSNVAGATNSSSASLTVNPTPPCVQPPTGLVSWWRGDGNAFDQIAGNNGVLLGNTTFGPGRVGQGFIFDGSGDAVLVGNPTNLQLQNFTIEAWIKRGSTTRASQEAGGGSIFAFGSGGFGVGILDNGTPYLTRIGIDNVAPNVAITDTAQHHFAVTKTGTTVVFYVDGVAYSVPAYSTTYTFGSSGGIGARGDNLGNSFWERLMK